MQIYQLPIAREDESLYSLAARIRAKNAARSDHDACCAMFANSRSTRVDEFPVNLAHFCICTKYAFGDEQSILDSFTLVAYFQRLGSKVWRSGSLHLSPQQTRYGLLSLSHGMSSRWQYCTHCLKCDRKRWGMGYWRRCHQLSGTLVCPLDGTPLSRARASSAFHTRFVFPEDVAIDNPSIPAAPATESTLVRIGRLNASILEHCCEGPDKDTLLAVILTELQARGLTKSSGTLSQNDFLHDFRSRYQELSELDEYRPYLDEPGVVRLAAALCRAELPGSSLHTVLIIDYLFGSWETALEYCKWHKTFSTHSVGATHTRQPQTQRADMFHTHRAICLDVLEEYPGISRSGFARAVPRSFRWLLSNDSEWFERTVPVYPSSHQRSLL